MKMATDDNIYGRAIETIESTNLSAAEHLALTMFLVDAGVSDEAAQYVLQRLSESCKVPPEDTLRSIKRDLETIAYKLNGDDIPHPDILAALRERQDSRCLIRGSKGKLKATYIVSPSFFDDVELQSGGSLRPLLEATISTEMVDRLESHLKSRSKENELKNLCFLSPSIRSAFLGGHISILKWPPVGIRDWTGPVEYMKNSLKVEAAYPEDVSSSPAIPSSGSMSIEPSTPDIERLPLPERFLLKIRSILSKPLHYIALEEKIRTGWPPLEQDTRVLGAAGLWFLRLFFAVLPKFLRLMLYEHLIKVIDRHDPTQKGDDVKFLPFGLCLKISKRVSKNEANALSLVERHTSISAPKLINVTPRDNDKGYLLMTRVFGVTMDTVLRRMTYEEQERLGRDLGKWISQLRRIPNRTNYLIGNTVGGPLIDHRFGTVPRGPFNSQADFVDRLTKGVEHHRQERPLSMLYEKKHKIYLTHSDLHMSNILVRDGRLSGIVDWENAAFTLEYWEYTRALFRYWADRRQMGIIDQAFDENYEKELEAEKFLWRWFGPVL